MHKSSDPSSTVTTADSYLFLWSFLAVDRRARVNQTENDVARRFLSFKHLNDDARKRSEEKPHRKSVRPLRHNSLTLLLLLSVPHRLPGPGDDIRRIPAPNKKQGGESGVRCSSKRKNEERERCARQMLCLCFVLTLAATTSCYYLQKNLVTWALFKESHFNYLQLTLLERDIIFR
jgi:hypothetical protein